MASLPGVAAIRAADGALRDRRFTEHLAEVEAALARVQVGAGEIRIPVDLLPNGGSSVGSGCSAGGRRHRSHGTGMASRGSRPGAEPPRLGEEAAERAA